MNAFIQTLKRWLRPPRRLRFTRFGTYVIFTTLGIGLGAMNTGNNLVYMVFGMMLGFITASGVISEMSLRGLETSWVFPLETFAGTPSTVRLVLKNAKKKIPSMGVSVETRWVADDGRVFDPIRANFRFVGALKSVVLDVPFLPLSRGRYWIKEIKIETRFPFGFFRKYLLREENASLIVFPKMDFSKPFDTPMSPAEKNRTTQQKGWGDTFWQIRDFVTGDSPRLISWKVSAKQARLMVRETELEADKKMTLVMEPGDAWKALMPQELEAAVSFAASLAGLKFKQGFAVGFLADGFHLPATANRRNLSRILEFLALFNPNTGPETGPAKNTRPNIFPPDSQLILRLWKRNQTQA